MEIWEAIQNVKYQQNTNYKQNQCDLFINAETFGEAPTALYGNCVMGASSFTELWYWKEDETIICKTNIHKGKRFMIGKRYYPSTMQLNVGFSQG